MNARPLGRLVAVVALAAAAVAGPATARAAGETPVRVPDQAVYDLAAVFDVAAERTAESLAAVIRDNGAADVVVVAETVDGPRSADEAARRAAQLRIALGVGDGSERGGALVSFGIDADGCTARVVVSGDSLFEAEILSPDDSAAIVARDLEPLVARCDHDSALLVGLGRIATAALNAGVDASGGETNAGPPFPDPVDGVAVYDHAGIFAPETIAAVERQIDAIEERTGAEIAVYTQLVEDGRSTDAADADARALMDQWGVGRKGFDDGLVILFDMYPDRRRGQVILYGGPGFRATFLDNAAKQRIFEVDMLPRLRAADFDGALIVAMERVDAAATPENAATLERARQINALAGLVVAPLVGILLVAWALWSWLRFGRDPVYLDDPSIHMAGPPEALTPAGAAFVLAGSSSRRALTTALLDIASRGTIAFREESHLLGLQKKVGIATELPEPDPRTRARQLRNDARKLGRAERLIEDRVSALARKSGGYIEPDDLLELGASVGDFDRALETEVVQRGWFGEKPSAVVGRWLVRAGLAVFAGVVAIGAGVALPSSGLLLIGIAVLIAGMLIGILSRSMPAVSLPGAMIRAMLAAYRRTLRKTMEQARSMDQVVAEAGLPWLETPDQVVVWGTALGLHEEIEQVLERTLEDTRDGRIAAGSAWVPAWYATGGGGSGLFGGDRSGFAGAAAGSGGLMASGAIPDLGGMMATLGTIGNSPSSSGGGGGGGGGGFGGGGSGGGGGGSGGGF
ncbi:MAG TPA: TPM domain-containing protein [Candidatus Limnocylindrales bacterium]|nr:TPM domain-containing protein [Candidatus Limnocylindrales bacterium]